ncbi:NADH-quinone oxidoreductase subunit F [bacterium]|nr:NADH-quinone oxidoreductase subunit F [bacterium]
MSTCGIAAGAEPVYRALADAVRDRELNIEVRKTGCVGMCSMEPLVEINVDGAPRTMYGEVGVDAALRLLDEHVGRKHVVPGFQVPGVDQLGFYEEPGHDPKAKQHRIVLRNCGIIDPTHIEDYIARGGYQGIKRALAELGPEGVIDEIKKSGLRGRGGAGYPAWMKWSFARKAEGDEKFMICNADEGDPGAYMDRSVLEGDPHAVIEGMLLAGYAIGATTGFMYVRAEYPLAIDRIENAIRQARRLGLVGKNILGSDFNYDLEVRLGAGAFVCGEETALMASIEGKRGTPWPRPPYPAEKGLWGKPSNINNVETLANVAPIIRNGGAWFAKIGTKKSSGTKVFAVTGKARHSGLVEIPMGTSLREIVMDVCGGVPPGRRVKAVQTGGPSGGVIPEDKLDTPVTYESLQELGSIMGSGGMIVMDDTDGMLDIARFYMGFCVEESCGKCAPCRIGGKQMMNILDKIADGNGTPDDIILLKRLARSMRKASLCGLGQTAPNPVLSTLRYFMNEYEEKLLQPV